MRISQRILACLLLCGCVSENTTITGISRARAIAIAKESCREYPVPFPVAEQARWKIFGSTLVGYGEHIDPVPDAYGAVESGYSTEYRTFAGHWLVTITDPERKRREYFRINRHGKIIERGMLPDLETTSRTRN